MNKNDMLKMTNKEFLNYLDSKLDSRIVGKSVSQITKEFVKNNLTKEEKKQVFEEEVEFTRSIEANLTDTHTYEATMNMFKGLISKLEEIGPENFVEFSSPHNNYYGAMLDEAELYYKEKGIQKTSPIDFYHNKWRKDLQQYNKAFNDFKTLKHSLKNINLNLG